VIRIDVQSPLLPVALKVHPAARVPWLLSCLTMLWNDLSFRLDVSLRRGARGGRQILVSWACWMRNQSPLRLREKSAMFLGIGWRTREHWSAEGALQGCSP